jgi:carbonic anhydrase
MALRFSYCRSAEFIVTDQRKTMSVIDECLKANEEYSKEFKLGHLPKPPACKLAIVTCMDARMEVEEMLGLKTGDAHIIRNAGGIITEDALRSLIISHFLLGTQEFMIINHTDCGMLTFKDEDLKARLQQETSKTADDPKVFYAFHDLETNVREQISKIKDHPWIPEKILVRGFIYDVKSGKLSEVV